MIAAFIFSSPLSRKERRRAGGARLLSFISCAVVVRRFFQCYEENKSFLLERLGVRER